MSTKTENANYLMAVAINSGITSPTELAVFMAQMEHESSGFTRFYENMNYSAERLLLIFRGRNGLDTLAESEAIVAGGQEGIANFVYGETWGLKYLGNIQEGDGWDYRGRGYIHLTGRENYEILVIFWG